MEDLAMNLFRSICCLFAGRCAGEEPKPTKETMRDEAPVSEGDLGQTEATLEKTGKDRMGHMEVETSKTAQEQTPKRHT
jgi:hypothetical protein